MDQRQAALKHLEITANLFEQKLKASKKIKSFQKIIKDWERVILSSSIVQREPERKDSKFYSQLEYYDLPISHDINSYELYLSWDINLASKMILENQNHNLVEFDLDILELDEGSINTKSNYIKIDNPVIVIKNLASPSGITIINGTHRIHEAQISKIKKRTIEGYYINDDLGHLDWMITDLMKNLYLMIMDFQTMGKYIATSNIFSSSSSMVKKLNVYKTLPLN